MKPKLLQVLYTGKILLQLFNKKSWRRYGQIAKQITKVNQMWTTEGHQQSISQNCFAIWEKSFLSSDQKANQKLTKQNNLYIFKYEYVTKLESG